MVAFNLTWHMLYSLFIVKHKKVENNFIHNNTDCACVTNGYCSKTVERKINDIIVSKDFFGPDLHSINSCYK